MFRNTLQIIGKAGISCLLLFLTACAPATTPLPVSATEVPQISNPASENCIQQGGSLEIKQRGDGAQYGVCHFEDNRQCEEWALMRGDCPVGGRKITGYVTEAGLYCAITGGEYAVTDSSGAEEKGTCTFPSGKQCDAREYFDGKCDPNASLGSYSDPFAYCEAVGSVDAPDASYTGEAMPDVIVQAMIQKGIVTADAPKEIQQNAVWRCMDNKVLACHFGANIPCAEKADASQAPTAAMDEYCKANPTAEIIPADIAGRTTVFEWACKDSKPEIARQVFTVDSQGFIAEYWYELNP